MDLAEWNEGVPCKAHGLGWCADCLSKANAHRTENGELRYDGDCAPLTYAEITGCDYGDAVNAMLKVGYTPGSGTPKEGIVRALLAAGYSVTGVNYKYDDLKALSKDGRKFVVSGRKGSKKGHAWSVTNGKAHRAYRAPFRYKVYEVKSTARSDRTEHESGLAIGRVGEYTTP